jgi:hypothetical protein
MIVRLLGQVSTALVAWCPLDRWSTPWVSPSMQKKQVLQSQGTYAMFRMYAGFAFSSVTSGQSKRIPYSITFCARSFWNFLCPPFFEHYSCHSWVLISKPRNMMMQYMAWICRRFQKKDAEVVSTHPDGCEIPSRKVSNHVNGVVSQEQAL